MIRFGQLTRELTGSKQCAIPQINTTSKLKDSFLEGCLITPKLLK